MIRHPSRPAAGVRTEAHHSGLTIPRRFSGPPESGDGLSRFPRPLPGSDVWAALDCPGSMPVMGPRPILLGTLTARRLHEVRAGESYRLISRPMGVEGRKRNGGVAMFDAADELVAAAVAIWLETT